MCRIGVVCAEPTAAVRFAGTDIFPAHAPPRSMAVFAETASSLALLDAIYDVALVPGRWPSLLASLASELGGCAATLHVGPAGGRFRISAASGVTGVALRSYEARYAALDPIVEAAGGGALEHTLFFADWMRPNGFSDAICLALLPPGAPDGAAIAVLRSLDAGPFGAAEAVILARLAPHLRRAMELHRHVSAACALPAAPLAEALDRLAAGVALLDAGCVLLWANRPAEALLRRGDGLSLDRDGALRTAAPGTTEALRRLVGATANAAVEGALAVRRPSGRAPLALHAVPLPPAPAAGDIEHAPVLPAALRPRVLLLVSDPERGAVPDAALQRRLREIYGLTAAEASVAARAARGSGLPEVARDLGLAVTTARTHAQRVFSKAGVRGQAELARQVERLSLLRPASEEYAEQ